MKLKIKMTGYYVVYVRIFFHIINAYLRQYISFHFFHFGYCSLSFICACNCVCVRSIVRFGCLKASEHIAAENGKSKLVVAKEAHKIIDPTEQNNKFNESRTQKHPTSICLRCFGSFDMWVELYACGIGSVLCVRMEIIHSHNNHVFLITNGDSHQTNSTCVGCAPPPPPPHIQLFAALSPKSIQMRFGFVFFFPPLLGVPFPWHLP